MARLILLCICSFVFDPQILAIQLETWDSKSNESLLQELLHADYVMDPSNFFAEIKTVVAVRSVDKVDVEKMEFSAQFDLIMTWQFNESKCENPNIKILPVTKVSSIWTPSICFFNEKNQVSTKDSSGDYATTSCNKVFYRKRVSVTVPCEIERGIIPGQAQTCTIRWSLCSGSAGMDVALAWDEHPLYYMDLIFLPHYALDAVVTYADQYSPFRLDSFLYATFYFSKGFKYFFYQIYAPNTFLVILSWLQLWVDNKKHPTIRILIGLTAMMLCLLMSYGANYLWISCFGNTCFVFTFLLLIESLLMLRKEKKDDDCTDEELKKKIVANLREKGRDKVLRIYYPTLFLLFCFTYFSYIFREVTIDILDNPRYDDKVNVSSKEYLL